MLTVGTVQVRMRDLGLIFSAAKWASPSARRYCAEKTSAGQTRVSVPRHILRACGTRSQASIGHLQGWASAGYPSAFPTVALSDAWSDIVAACAFIPTAWKDLVLLDM